MSVIMTLAAIILFILTEDMRNPMVMTDRWTWIHAVGAIIQIVVAFLSKKKREDDEDDEDQNAVLPQNV